MAIPAQWIGCIYCGKDVPASRMNSHIELRHQDEMRLMINEAIREDMINRIEPDTI